MFPRYTFFMRQRERIVPKINFREGINAVPGFFGGDIRDILNLDLDDNGFCVPRPDMRPVENPLIGTYPRSIRRTWKATEADATDTTHIFFSTGTLKIGLATSSSLLAGLSNNDRLILIRNNDYLEVQIDGTTLTIVNEDTPILTFQASYSGGTAINFQDGDEVHVVILFEGEDDMHYRDGDQFVVAHWLGDEVSDPVTRFYRIDADDSYVSSHRGRILYIAGENGKYFIDVRKNRRYDWEFRSLQINRLTSVSGLANLVTLYNTLVQRFVVHYTANPNLDIYEDFPNLREEARLAEAVPTAFKVIYAADSVGFRGPASNVKSALAQTALVVEADMYNWILQNRDELLQRSIANFSNNDYALITNIGKNEGTRIWVDTENLPNWEGLDLQIEVYGAPIPEDLYEFDEDENTLTIIDEDAFRAIPDSEYFRIGSMPASAVETEQSISVSLIAQEDQFVYLDAQFNHVPPEKLYAITEHAGRIYGVDGETQEVIFSHIDGQGVSNRWVFPPQNAMPTDASGVSPIQAIEQMPNRGGLYVFKRDGIHYIEGQNIFSGLYNISVDTSTDISAADYKKNIGCISRRSIENDGESVLFIGSDHQVYQLVNKSAKPIGRTIKPILRKTPIEDLQNVVTEWHNERFYITLLDTTLVLNTERKYWTRFDWVLKDLIWSRGGEFAESIFYGLTADDQLVILNVEDTDSTFPTLWEANLQIRNTGSLLTGVYVYTDDGEAITVTVKGNEPIKEVVRSFIPKLNNKYRAGCHVKGRHIDIKIQSEAPVTIDRIDFEETV